MCKNFKLKFDCKRVKFIVIIILLLLSFLFTFKFDYYVGANTGNNIEETIESGVGQILDSIDMSEIESMVEDIEDLGVFNNGIKEKIASIIRGQYFTDYTSLFSAIFSLIIVDIKGVLPIILTLIAIGMISSIIASFKVDSNNSIDTVYLACLSVVVITVIIALKEVLQSSSNVINLITNQMQIFFPILITLLGTIGSFTTVSIYNPLVAVLTGVVNIVFDKVLFPIFIVITILTILNNLSSKVKLNNLINFLNSSFKWMVGIVFTLFAGFLSIQGISAGKFDSISIKATKFAMKSYIPIIGGYISEGMDFLVLGSVLVKNTIGLVGIVIIFLTVISPILHIIILKLGLQLSSGIIEISGNDKISEFISSCSKILILPIVLILGVSFMYIITLTLIMCTANIF